MINTGRQPAEGRRGNELRAYDWGTREGGRERVPFLSSIVTVSLAHFIKNLGTQLARGLDDGFGDEMAQPEGSFVRV